MHLASLTDVNVGGATLGNVLAYNGSMWVVSTVSAGMSQLPDRISSSNSHAMVLSTPAGTVSISTGNVAGTSYFDTMGRWIGPGISVTTMHGVSSTSGYFSSRVGIGVTQPERLFHVRGTDAIWRLDRDADTVGLQLHRFPSGDFSTPWKGFLLGVAASGANSGYFTIADYGQNVTGPVTHRLIIDTNGNVGVGTTSPSAKLDVAGSISASGAIQIGTSALTCTAGVPGAIRYNSGALEYCNGTSWSALSAGMSGSGAANHIAYWTGAGSLAHDANQLYWDPTNNRLGIGTNTPTTAITVNGDVSITSDFYAGAGTNALPAYSFGGDTNTGMYLAGADTLGFTTGGSQRARLLSSGLIVTGYVSTTGIVDIGTQALGNAGDSAGTPTYSWSGDTNTGVFTPGADQVGFTTAGTERLRVTSAGFVGIGTATPSARLDVTGHMVISNGTSRTLSFGNVGVGVPAAGSTGMKLQLYGNNANAMSTGDYALGVESNNLWFNAGGSGGTNGFKWYHNATHRMTLSGAGNLWVDGGISATSGITVGTSSISCSGGNNGGTIRYNSGALEYCDGSGWQSLSTGGMSGSGAANHIAYWSGASTLAHDANQLYWDATNNRLGIGTTTLNTALGVNGDVSITSDYYAGAGTNALPSFSFGRDANTGMYSPALDEVAFTTGGSQRGRFLSGGLIVTGYVSTTGIVDIGTQALGNAGDSAGTPTYSWSGDTNTGVFTPGTDQVGFTTAGTERLRVNAMGNVGIGTNAPTGKLTIGGAASSDGGIYIATNTSRTMSFGNVGTAAPAAGSVGMKIQLYGSNVGTMAVADYAIGIESNNMWFNTGGTGTNGFKWYSQGSQRMVLDGNGNLGISNSAPKASLDVIGNISASGAIQVGISTLPCTTGIAGAMRYNAGNMEYCNGSGWSAMGGGGGGGDSLTCAGGANPQVYDGRCYTIFTARDLPPFTGSTTPDAQGICQLWGGPNAGLVIINDASEQTFLTTTYASTGPLIGLTDNGSFGSSEGNPRWWDGTTTAGYSNWSGTTNQHGNNDAVRMNSDGTWRYESTNGARDYVCETPDPVSGHNAQRMCGGVYFEAEFTYGGAPGCNSTTYNYVCYNSVRNVVSSQSGPVCDGGGG